MKNRKLKTAFVIVLVLAIWMFTRDFGPLDTFPRVQQSAQSADGKWKLEVFRRKLAPFDPFGESEVVFRTTDVKGGRVSNRRIIRFRLWGGEERKFDIRFESDLIYVDDFRVIDKTNLEVRMCHSLECF
jgi:hypothetical protein